MITRAEVEDEDPLPSKHPLHRFRSLSGAVAALNTALWTLTGDDRHEIVLVEIDGDDGTSDLCGRIERAVAAVRWPADPVSPVEAGILKRLTWLLTRLTKPAAMDLIARLLELLTGVDANLLSIDFIEVNHDEGAGDARARLMRACLALSSPSIVTPSS